MIYLIMVIIGIFIMIWSWVIYPEKVTLFTLLGSMVTLFIKLLWVWLLNFLCCKNMEGLSWFLFFLPYIIIFAIIYYVYREVGIDFKKLASYNV
jgi:hypothetical protein